jgi:hypothetical protein
MHRRHVHRYHMGMAAWFLRSCWWCRSQGSMLAGMVHGASKGGISTIAQAITLLGLAGTFRQLAMKHVYCSQTAPGSSCSCKLTPGAGCLWPSWPPPCTSAASISAHAPLRVSWHGATSACQSPGAAALKAPGHMHVWRLSRLCCCACSRCSVSAVHASLPLLRHNQYGKQCIMTSILICMLLAKAAMDRHMPTDARGTFSSLSSSVSARRVSRRSNPATSSSSLAILCSVVNILDAQSWCPRVMADVLSLCSRMYEAGFDTHQSGWMFHARHVLAYDGVCRPGRLAMSCGC